MRVVFVVVIGVLLLVIVLASGLLPRTNTQVNSDRKSREASDEFGILPVVESDGNNQKSDLLAKNAEKRFSRNERYNNRNQVWELPNDLRVTSKSAHWIFEVPAIPVKQSDEIIVGTVEGNMAFLSTDKSGVYSEFYVLVDGSLKSKSEMSAGDKITLEREGGAVKFPSGKTQPIGILNGQRMPVKSGRYIFFLKRVDGLATYQILTGYQSFEGIIRPLDTIDPFRQFNGESELNFLRKIKLETESESH